MAKLKYAIEFVENLSDENIEYINKNLEKVKEAIFDKLNVQVKSLCGKEMVGDIKLELDLIGDEEVETW